MKYLVLIGDGMADEKIVELGGKTPIQYANTPNMDRIAAKGTLGMAATVPEGFPPGSDVANLSVMGYDPRLYYSGRSPLEAASIGVELDDDDVAFRCNLVTLSEEEVYEEKTMVDYSSDEITSQESGVLIREVNARLGNDALHFYPGFGFRHLLVWKGGPDGSRLTPPHDISGRVIGPHLPEGEGAETLTRLMKESNKFLPGHAVNAKRKESGLRPANSVWFWGKGKKPAMPGFYDKYRVSGSVISAVDLIKGIGIYAGLDVVELEGVTGTVHTNYRGKVRAALEEFDKGRDFVYVHVEAPDAASHRGELDTKIRAIEMVDEMLGMLLEGLDRRFKNYRVMLLPDHPTPLATLTHSDSPVPFVVYTKGLDKKNENAAYDEEAAEKTGFIIKNGHELMDYFIHG
ncbi:MAG TPA: cofactor-independent phosphoglycerate mutase [Bacillota bacterium]|nr:cofactor-independent phosphoglycerate mutase [Bacillota bacterium]